jgi:hypothetical protein
VVHPDDTVTMAFVAEPDSSAAFKEGLRQYVEWAKDTMPAPKRREERLLEDVLQRLTAIERHLGIARDDGR